MLTLLEYLDLKKGTVESMRDIPNFGKKVAAAMQLWLLAKRKDLLDNIDRDALIEVAAELADTLVNDDDAQTDMITSPTLLRFLMHVSNYLNDENITDKVSRLFTALGSTATSGRTHVIHFAVARGLINFKEYNFCVLTT